MAGETNLGDWIDGLSAESEDVRRQARVEIVRIGQDAAPTLVRAIEAELIPWAAQSFACGTLAEIKPRFAGEKPDALMQALEESRYWESCAAVSRALVNFGTAATAPLLALLSCGDKVIYPSAAHALAEIAKLDPSIMPAVIKAMDEESWNVRSGAAEVLLATEPPPPVEAIAPLIRSLKEEDRFRIVNALEQYGALAIPSLLESLRSPDWRIRAGSANALGMIEIGRKVRRDSEPYFEMGVVPALIEALGDEKVEVLLAAGDALSKIGPPETNPAIPVFLSILRERNPLMFAAAVSEMGWIPYPEPGLEPELIDALADKDARIRAAAATLLGNVAFTSRLKNIEVPATSAAVPVLLGALTDEDEEVRFQAARALAEIAPEVSAAGVPILHSALAHGWDWEHVKGPSRPWDRQKDAIRALGLHGPAAAEAVPALSHALQAYILADLAAWALSRMGPLASAAVPALLQALGKGDEQDRYSAAKALAAIGPEAATAGVNILFEYLRGPDEFDRCTAAVSLCAIGLPAAKVAMSELLELMNHESEHTRHVAAEALKDLGWQPPDTD